MTIEIEIQGLEEAQARLGTDILGVITPALTRSVLRMEGAMKVYPPPPGDGEWAANTTPRQRRAFFALLRRGAISGRRTGTLGRRWTHRVQRGADQVLAEVGNNTEYGPFVQSKLFQARFHRGRWQTDQVVMEAELPRLVADVEGDLRRAFEE